jgi:hypothetical protein
VEAPFVEPVLVVVVPVVVGVKGSPKKSWSRNQPCIHLKVTAKDLRHIPNVDRQDFKNKRTKEVDMPELLSK